MDCVFEQLRIMYDYSFIYFIYVSPKESIIVAFTYKLTLFLGKGKRHFLFLYQNYLALLLLMSVVKEIEQNSAAK